MGLNKVEYTDNVTVIHADNLNEIQDAIIELEESTPGAPTEAPEPIRTAAEGSSPNFARSDHAHDFGSDFKTALLQLAAKVAYIDENGQTYYDALANALMHRALASISAVYTQSGTVYDTDSLDSLKDDLTVTAHYSDSTTVTLDASDYSLSGTLEAGTSTITVTYGSKTTTFTVTVTQSMVPAAYRQVDYLYGNGSAHITISGKNISIGNTVHAIGEQLAADTSANRHVCGGGNSAAWITAASFFSDGTVGASYGASQSKVTLTTPRGTPVEFTTQFTSSALNVTAKSNGETQTNNLPKTGMTASTSGFKVFWVGSSTAFIGRVYFVELLNGSTPLVRLYPCVRRSDNKAGLYDTVGNAFYPSETGTDFVAG